MPLASCIAQSTSTSQKKNIPKYILQTSPISQTSFLSWTFFAVSYSKTTLVYIVQVLSMSLFAHHHKQVPSCTKSSRLVSFREQRTLKCINKTNRAFSWPVDSLCEQSLFFASTSLVHRRTFFNTINFDDYLFLLLCFMVIFQLDIGQNKFLNITFYGYFPARNGSN